MTDQTPVDPNAAPPAGSPYGAAPVQEPSKAKAVGGAIVKKIIGVVIALVVIGVGSYIWKNVSGDITIAKVGDCVTESTEADGSDVKVVDCADAKAAYKVIGIIENVSDATFTASDDLCTEKFPTWEYVFWQGKKGGSGDAWCVEPTKK